MSGKILWPALNVLMALTLVVAACTPAAISGPSPTPTTSPKEPSISPTTVAHITEQPKQEVPAPSDDKPKYGGTITFALTTDPTTFDDALVVSANVLVNEELLTGDWTGLYSWTAG